MEKSKFIKEIATIIVQQTISDYEGIDGKRYKYITMNLESWEKIYKYLHNYSGGTSYSLEEAVKGSLEEFMLFGINLDNYNNVTYNGITVNYIK